ncbi:unnamed protein product [Amoebophrya sp. A120]|nr:unnamed protein product [Amoebophrya sp. A120]|eukprot:GSA120T00001033001.1
MEHATSPSFCLKSVVADYQQTRPTPTPAHRLYKQDTILKLSDHRVLNSVNAQHHAWTSGPVVVEHGLSSCATTGSSPNAAAASSFLLTQASSNHAAPLQHVMREMAHNQQNISSTSPVLPFHASPANIQLHTARAGAGGKMIDEQPCSASRRGETSALTATTCTTTSTTCDAGDRCCAVRQLNQQRNNTLMQQRLGGVDDMKMNAASNNTSSSNIKTPNKGVEQQQNVNGAGNNKTISQVRRAAAPLFTAAAVNASTPRAATKFSNIPTSLLLQNSTATLEQKKCSPFILDMALSSKKCAGRLSDSSHTSGSGQSTEEQIYESDFESESTSENEQRLWQMQQRQNIKTQALTKAEEEKKKDQVEYVMPVSNEEVELIDGDWVICNNTELM